MWLPEDERTPEIIAERFDEISATDGQVEFAAGSEQSVKFLGKAAAAQGQA